ncbi:hypothetical protein NQ314_005043 [Rhamnusium bicolor]|uniref:Uncharacterized protein n=1 Tax=Rhamnusium bicolor TaxID=1586634 RepID=A0AAV8ZJN0_9CUCU|nr:hypothetical protein NQ314_005043 [Rhamnusium bicolor]
MYLTVKCEIQCLLTKKYVDQTSSKYLTEFLRTCLVESPQAWKRAGADLKTILDSTIICYRTISLMKRSS